MKIIANMRKAFGLALAFALALSLSAPAQGQSVLNQIGKRAKNAVKTRTTMGADRAIQKTLDKAEDAIEKGVTNAGRGRSGKGNAPTVGKGSAAEPWLAMDQWPATTRSRRVSRPVSRPPR